ncbi:phage tail spike protein [Streptococcus suis]|uniref:phage tail spike protein n=1 Tax=Streptococcus suis TaxID=1307 RepID=UPI001EE6DE62|nr:phage tail spike protein [Streptococcus suis]
MIYLKDGNIPLNLAYDDDIVQEANSTYQLSFKFPLTDGKWNLLKREVFLLADDLHGEQEFFIFEAKKANGYVQVYAKQVATLLNYYSVNTISVDRVPGQTVMTALAGSVKRPCPFTFFSDILDRHTFNESNVSVMDALIKDKHSIVGQWGGDLVRDKYQVKLLKNGGTENESLFMYKKNISSYEESENINNLKTRLHLKKTIQGQSEGEADRVIAVTVDSPLIGQYRQIYETDIEVNDQDVTDEATLTAYGQRYFSSTLCDLVENSINLDVKGKSDVSVKMFDTVSVFHERFDVDLRLKITSYHFGPMSKRLKSIGFGKLSQSVKSTVASMVAGSVDKATGRLSASFEQKLQKEIDNANRHFNTEFDKRIESINDGLEQSKAEAEAYADNIKQQIDGQLAESDRQYQQAQQAQDRQIAESLRLAGTSTNLANAARALAEQANNDLVQVKASAESQARLILEQAQRQSELINRVTTVENVVDGTKVTVTELSKTLNKATGDIDSVTSRTKTVEDNLSQTRAQYEHLTQTVNAQTGQIDSINRKTVDLQSGIDGVTQRFENLRVGATNYIRDFGFAISHTFMNYRSAWRYERIADPTAHSGYHIKATCTQAGGGGFYERFFDLKGAEWQGRTMTYAIDIKCSKPVRILFAPEAFDDYATQIANVNVEWQRFISSKKVRFRVNNAYTFYIHGGQWQVGDVVYIRDPQLEDGTMATTPSPAPEDQQSYADAKIAEYKHTVDGRFATIQSSVDNKANLIDFQRVQETAKLYERILGASENEVNSNLARQVLTSSLWQTEITRLPRAGGKNYFLNSNFKEGLQFWENNTSSPDLSIDPQLASQVKRVGALHVDTGNTGAFAHGFYQIVDMPVSANEQVTVSFDVAAFPNNDAGLIIIVNNHLFDIRKEIPAAEIPKTSVFSPTSLKRKAVTLTIPQDCDRLCCIIIFGPGTVGNMVFADMQIEKGGAASDYRPNPTDANRELEAVTTRVTQLAGAWSVQHLNQAGDILSQANLSSSQFLLEAAKIRLKGKTLADEIQAIDGKFNTLFVADGTFGKLNANVIDSQAITADKLKVDQAFFNKLMANDAYLKQLFAQSAFITSVQAVAVSAKQIVGGIAKALNDGMDVNFDESKINFYTNVAAIRRIYTGHPTQFIKFETEGNYSRTIIGSNRNGGEVFNSATFAGIVVENTNNINTEDNVRIYGDNTLFRHAQGDVGWNINSVTQRIIPANINAESEIWSKHFVAPDKNSKPVRLDTAVAALWDIWNHIIYNNFEFNEALRTHIKARRDNWKFELNL